MGFTVTPGKALTSQHARGSGTVTLYGTVALELPETPMETLTLGGETLRSWTSPAKAPFSTGWWTGRP